jgi:hypothetical protein
MLKYIEAHTVITFSTNMYLILLASSQNMEYFEEHVNRMPHSNLNAT